MTTSTVVKKEYDYQDDNKKVKRLYCALFFHNKCLSVIDQAWGNVLFRP